MNRKICKRCYAEVYLNGTYDNTLPKNVPQKDRHIFKFRCEILKKVDESELVGFPSWRKEEFSEIGVHKVIHEVDIPKKFNAQILNEWGHMDCHEAMNFKCFSKIEPNKSCPFYIEHLLIGGK